MSSDLHQKAQSILQKTEQMAALLLQGDIDAFNAEKAERDQLIQEVELMSFDQDTSDPSIIEARELLIKTQQLNNQLASDLQTLQQRLLDEKSRASKGRKMNKAYQANQK